MKRFGLTRWNGGLREGRRAVSTESRALENYPSSISTRYGDKPGTNPKNCSARPTPRAFTMSFVRMLEMPNFVPEQVDGKSDVVIKKDGDGFSITSFHLTVTATIPRYVPVDRVESKGVVPRVQADERRDWL